MTVRELIETLREFSPDLPVARDAGEGEGSGVRIIYDVMAYKEATEAWDRNVMNVVLIR